MRARRRHDGYDAMRRLGAAYSEIPQSSYRNTTKFIERSQKTMWSANRKMHRKTEVVVEAYVRHTSVEAAGARGSGRRRGVAPEAAGGATRVRR